MANRGRDPYQVLGVGRDASRDELRSAYRRLVQLHHPDHNGGSPQATRQFEEIQAAYAQIRDAEPDGGGPPPRKDDPYVESRVDALQRELREAQLAREKARQAAREASAERPRRPSDEELGYVTTDDSFSKILADARSELAARFSDAQEHPTVRRAGDLVGELDEIAARLTRKPSPPDG